MCIRRARYVAGRVFPLAPRHIVEPETAIDDDPRGVVEAGASTAVEMSVREAIDA
jgi:hypothetical protein